MLPSEDRQYDSVGPRRSRVGQYDHGRAFTKSSISRAHTTSNLITQSIYPNAFVRSNFAFDVQFDFDGDSKPRVVSQPNGPPYREASKSLVTRAVHMG